MIKIGSQTHVLRLLATLVLATACNTAVRKDTPNDKEHPRIIKTGGNTNVQCGLLDQAGNLWFGTSVDGLFKYDGKSFRQFLVADGLSSNSINDLVESKDGSIWIGTKNGISLYDGKAFTKILIPLPKNLPPNTNKFYQTQIVHDIMQDKSGKLWFATIDGVYVYDGKSFALFIINESANGFLSSNDKAERILEDREGNIWFGGRTNEGVFRYDGNNVINIKLQELITLRFDSKQVTHSWAWPQLQDKNGNIWFSNWAGVYRYDGKTFTSFTNADGIPGDNGLVAKIIEDKKGNLWFGGAGGLSRFDGKSFTGYKDGLINPWIWAILEDRTGGIWVGTRDSGLYFFDGKIFINYSQNK
jgi:ligand-binding sensor domain-containing protein